MIFANRAPVPPREKTFVVAPFAVDIVGEHGDHVLISMMIQVVNLVSLVDNVTHHLRRRSIDNGR